MVARSVGVGANARFWNAASTCCAIVALNLFQVLLRNRIDFTARLRSDRRTQEMRHMCSMPYGAERSFVEGHYSVCKRFDWYSSKNSQYSQGSSFSEKP